MSNTPTVVIVEDSMPQARLFKEYLREEKIDLIHVTNGQEAHEVIAKTLPALVILDLNLPDSCGKEILQWIHENNFPSSIIVITGHGSVDIAVDVMRLGAEDFLEKPVTANRLKTTVRNILEKHRLRHIVRNFESSFERESYHGFIGSSLPMQAVYRIIDAAAPSKATVFITGESGTGKEVCAEAIHRQGNRSDKPFIALNCGAIPENLMETEIFGHTKGAFTGAISEHEGAVSRANGGTLFLDEIGEMNMDLQTKLLRFVQSGSFQKIGSTKEETVDIRFICATNRDPLTAVAEGRLREDLYYRLHVVPIQLPPLRERGEDIAAIANHFLTIFAMEEGKDFKQFSLEAKNTFLSYNWPGNVRQLQNIIRNIVVLHNGEKVELNQLPPPINSNIDTLESPIPQAGTTPSNNDSPEENTTILPLAITEQRAIEHAIGLCDGNIPKAAALLEVSASTIYRKKQNW